MAKFSALSAVEIAHEKLGIIRAPIRSAKAAAEAIRSCEDSKMRGWGIDPVTWRGLKSRPMPLRPWSEWLSADDYPRDAERYAFQGAVIAELTVAPDGTARECKALNRNPYKGFSDSICSALKKRARFQPAIDANGNAVTAPFVLFVMFRLD